MRDPSELTPKPVLGDIPTSTSTKAQWKDTFGDPTPEPEPKHPTEDFEGVPSAKTVIDENNKIIADTVGLGGLGTVPRRTATTPLGERLAGSAVRAPEVKPPTDDVEGARTAKSVLDESNKIIADAIGLGGGGYTSRSMATPASGFGTVGYGPQPATDPGAVARRPFVLGTPHHAASAAAMAGADPTAIIAMTNQVAMTEERDETAIQAAVLDASLAQVETSIRVLKRDLESLEEYYRELAAHRDELDAEMDSDTTERDTDDPDEESAEVDGA